MNKSGVKWKAGARFLKIYMQTGISVFYPRLSLSLKVLYGPNEKKRKEETNLMKYLWGIKMKVKSRMMKKREPRRGKRGSRLLRWWFFTTKQKQEKLKELKCVTINRRIITEKQRGWSAVVSSRLKHHIQMWLLNICCCNNLHSSSGGEDFLSTRFWDLAAAISVSEV